MAPIVSTWAWDKWGVYKYLLFAPLVARVLHSRPWEDTSNISTMAPDQWWCLHVLLVSALRCLTHTLWGSFSNMLFLTRNRRIVKDGVDFHQIDKEWNWDNFIILQAIVAAVAFYCSSWPWPWGHDNQLLQVWSMKGISLTLLVHVGASEPLFYWLHRSFHGGALYRRYHSLHHSIVVPQSFTAGYATPMEHLALCVVMGLPLALTFLSGCGSLSLVYIYVLGFDFLNCMKHCNVEMMPSGLFEAFPFLRYIICTPTYHTLHHKEKNANFCLFMPLFDALGGTLHEDSWMLHKKNRLVKNEEVPDFIFLAHVVDVVQSLHVPFVFRSFASMPFTTRLFLLPMWPGAFLVMLLMWAYSKTFLYTFYNLRGRLHQTWVVPRYGFHYFLPSVKEGINKQIEMGILRADKMGAKVISLAALNKNESLNGGGTLFVQKHPNLKVRVCHGNTLTAAVILNEIPKDVKEVFLTGATSKLGRAIALYLCRKGVRVLMLTLSTDRFQKIQREVPLDHQQYLVQVTKYQPAQTCKTWIVGKWLSPREQRWAPSGTHFHQFVVPPIFGFRRDCTYGNLAAMRLPADVQGLGHCEYTLDRGVVHACHAGGVVHFLEGWTHHEVGAIDVDRIDVVWEAALRHGLRPVRSEGVNV